jgi:hypothetical protein
MVGSHQTLETGSRNDNVGGQDNIVEDDEVLGGALVPGGWRVETLNNVPNLLEILGASEAFREGAMDLPWMRLARQGTA